MFGDTNLKSRVLFMNKLHFWNLATTLNILSSIPLASSRVGNKRSVFLNLMKLNIFDTFIKLE